MLIVSVEWWGVNPRTVSVMVGWLHSYSVRLIPEGLHYVEREHKLLKSLEGQCDSN